MASVGGLSLAVGFHFGWDAIVLTAPDGPPLGAARTVVGLLLMVSSLALYGRLIVIASGRSRQQFAPRSALRLWGWRFKGL